MEEDRKKRIRRRIILGCAAFVILAVIIISRVINNAENGSLTANKTLFVQTYGEVSYNRLRNMGTNESAAPDKVRKYVIVRSKRDGGISSFMTYGINASRAWTQEKLESVDCVVYAFSDTNRSEYGEYVNGRATGRKTGVFTETVELFYYNPAAKAVFRTETLTSGGLPSQTTSPRSSSVSTARLKEAVRDTLGIFYISSGAYAAAAVAVVMTAFLAVFTYVMIKKTKKIREGLAVQKTPRI